MKIELDDKQESVLLEVSLDDGFELLDIDDDKEEILKELVDIGVIESILGEQFYVSIVGREYLRLKGYLWQYL